jgi:hypothetical protein
MARQFVPAALAMTFCLVVSLAHAAPRGKEGEKQREGKSPGGNQTERKAQGKQGNERSSSERSEEHRGGTAGGKKSPGGDWSQRTHGGKPTDAQAGKHREQSGTHDAAAGAAAANRKSPQASGAQGAAAGAAAAKRKSPQASGAQGAAAGAAAANRKGPQASGAEGAAAGAAAANRNSPQISGAAGAAAGAAAANRNSPQVSGAEGAAVGAAAANRNGADGGAAGYAAVRNSFNHPNIYGQKWYGDHPGVWAPSGWAAGAAWAPSAWGAVAAFSGYGSATPTSYNYGVNVNAQDGNVIVDGQNVGTTDEFSQQAADLAETGAAATPSDTDEWLPIGVFAMVRNENQHPQLILQLAINKQGILRGNYTDELTDHTLPIQGAVDKRTQRAAWTVGGNKQTVMEAGLSDLTDGEAPALIHKNGKTDHWILVRLEQPNGSAGDGAEK